MTNNQIAYLNYVETVRANRAKEGENVRSNKAREREAKRHNVAGESLGWASLGESHRHNLLTERSMLMEIQEKRRSNLAREDISRQELAESARHNRAQESIGNRNIALGYAQNAARYATTLLSNRSAEKINAQRIAYERDKYQAELGERRRHNVANETMEHRKLGVNFMGNIMRMGAGLLTAALAV